MTANRCTVPLRSCHGVKMPRWASSMEGGNFRVEACIQAGIWFHNQSITKGTFYPQNYKGKTYCMRQRLNNYRYFLVDKSSIAV